ncbi:SpoIIE family protein phosphatase [Breznakiella homolactica]|uniref:SpoIIE family protein phosphatase n=2 Tax=Breznakiella homolactica TaxID=2798577 RepID=A0A7T7XS29_9SPIR|nr:SpoIIE family protein phosphatase [Breznakiella homolactica]
MRVRTLLLTFPLLVLFLVIPLRLHGLSDFYWEDPELFSPGTGGFPVSAFNGTVSLVAWQESEATSGGDGRIRVSAAVKNGDGEWVIRRSVGGPYAYSGSEPSILSAAVDRRGRLFLAAAASGTHTEILYSDDFGETFQSYRIDSGSNSSVAPRIFPMDNGGYLLFVTRGGEESLSIYYAQSDDGIEWSGFRPFVTEGSMQLNFLPAHVSMGGQEFIVFQSFIGDDNPSFQLYFKSSSDGGATWTPSRLITGFQDPSSVQNDPGRFDNQRAHLSVQGNSLLLVWERRLRNGNPQIYGAFLNRDGSIQGTPERINRDSAYCNNPIAFEYGGEPTVIWFDNRRGQNRAFLAQRWGIDWQNYDISGSAGGTVSFARPAVGPDGLFVFWQAPRQGRDRIIVLRPDTTVAPPVLAAQNFQDGRRTRNEVARITWRAPYDSSGIMGYSYSWSQDPDEVPPPAISIFAASSHNVEERTDEDGSWYFSIRAQDFAGNWSSPTRLEFIRDTTPPPAATIIPPLLDENGYLVSNTFDIRWNPPPASDIAGYTWNLEFIAPLARYASLDTAGFAAEIESEHPGTGRPPSRVMGQGNAASYTNQDDGVWRFAVSAIDEVGNIGPVSSIYFRTNKYIPYTYITYADASQDEQGILSLKIIGRGFAQNGNVSRIFLDLDGQAPYDREFRLDRGDYRIVSDREIDGITIEDLDAGLYRIGMEHPVRGLYLTRPLVSVDEMGTVKFGDYSMAWEPSWAFREQRRFVVDTALLILSGVMVFCAIGIIVSVRGIGSVVAESAAIRVEAVALITGDIMPSERKKRMKKMKKRGVGLRVKLASLTIAVVLAVVVMVSAPMYVMMTRTQEETLLKGLWDRSTVLLEGLASSARAYLPSGNILELGFLPAQTAAIPEARYVTITGFGSESTVFSDYVWATNDPEILSKINTSELQPGVSRLEDILSPRLTGITEELNNRARLEVGALTESISSLTQEAVSLALRTDAASRERLSDIQVTIRSLETRLTERLTEIARQIGSEPAFSTENLAEDESRTYIFFKPVMYRQGSEDIYFRGLIRLEVSIDSIVEQIADGQRSLLRIIMIVALSALAIGTLAALAFSSFIIRPIRKLVSHVEKIRDTEDKAKLAGVDIHIKTKDEIAVLGNTINDMTHGLVKAALASQDLTIGKEVQKKFIPLDLDKEGNKLTSGFKDTKNAHFFGYYEGAKGVSGDYFDYQDLDGRYFAIIKCDVAGKGIPAALIMIQVATMFLNHFKNWKPNTKGMQIEEVVYQINDFIETLGFKGRFAAFTLCLFDSETGLVRFCNAGDNIVHWYDASEGRMKTVTLPETPATGVLPNFLVESKGGYTVQTLTIDHGDILFLYTDGIEEAKRKFRDRNFREILCSEGNAPVDTPHANHSVGQGDEEMGPDRVEAIINAVMNRQMYTLHKYHNPEGDADLQFDFSSCSGKVEETIMALVSVEKMFRIYKDPKAGEDARVLVDKKADDFLKKHFLQYRTYCSETKPNQENDAYLYYTHVREDEQYDDLTILGIKRK